MKNIAIATALTAAMIIPSMASANTLFPDLSFPTDWSTQTETTVGQSKIVKPVILPTPDE